MNEKKSPKAGERTHVRYFVRIAGDGGSIFSESGYTEYYERLSRSFKNKRLQVYGPAQAREHISQLRNHVYEGKKHYASTKFQIVKETTIRQVVETH